MFPFPSLKKEMICLTPRVVSCYRRLSDEISKLSEWAPHPHCSVVRGWFLLLVTDERTSDKVFSNGRKWALPWCWMPGACHWRVQWQLTVDAMWLSVAGFSHQLHICRVMCFIFLMTSLRKGLPLDSGAILIQRLRFQYFNLVTNNVIHKFSGVGSWINLYVWFWE